MALLSRAEYEQELARVEEREKALNRLLVTCVCDCPQDRHAILELVDGTKFHSGACERCECQGFVGCIDSFTHEMGYKNCELEARWLKNRLVMGALVIADKGKMQRSQWFAWVVGGKWDRRNKERPKLIGGSNSMLLKHQSPKFRPTTYGELCKLQAQGVTLLPSWWGKERSSDTQGDKWEPADGIEAQASVEELAANMPEWQRVPVAEAKRLRNEPGWMVRIPEFPANTPEDAQWGEVLEVGEHAVRARPKAMAKGAGA